MFGQLANGIKDNFDVLDEKSTPNSANSAEEVTPPQPKTTPSSGGPTSHPAPPKKKL